LSKDPEFALLQHRLNKLYGPEDEMSPTDVAYCEEAENDFDKRSEAGIGGEYNIIFGINKLRWLGKKVQLSPTAKYDDYKNGVDSLLSIGGNAQNYYLGIDVKTYYNRELIKEARQKMLGRLFGFKKGTEEIELDKNGKFTGQLASLKYGLGEDIKYFPRIVMEMNPEYALRMMKIITKLKEGEEIKEAGELKDEEKYVLEKIKNQFITEVESQIKEIIKVADALKESSMGKRVVKELDVIRDKYAKFLEIFVKEKGALI